MLDETLIQVLITMDRGTRIIYLGRLGMARGN